MTFLRRSGIRSGEESGAELIEFAVAFPLLLVVTLAIVDFGLMMQRVEVLTSSAREGARVAAQQGATQQQIEDHVYNYVQYSRGVPVSAGNPAVIVTTGSLTTAEGAWPTRTVRVSYAHNYLFLPNVIGWFGGSFGPVTLQAQATMRHLTPGAGP